MDNKKALEMVNALIEEHKRNEVKSALGEFLSILHSQHMAPLKKAIEDVQEELRKVDPTSKLPGTLLDKDDQQMGSPQNLNPDAGQTVANGIEKAAPSETPSIMHASEGKKDWKGWMGKCMKTLTASQKPEALGKPYASDAQRKWAHTEAGTKALGGKAAVHHWDEETKGKSLPEHVSKGDLNKKYEGFKAVEEHAKESGARDPAAVAAAAGREKYGKEAFQHAAATGHKMHKGESKHDRCVADVKENSPDVKNPHAVCVAEGVKPAKWGKSEEMAKAGPLGGTGMGAPSTPTSRPNAGFGAVIAKDDKPHPPGSPEERSHAVAEGMVSLPKAAKQMDAKGHEAMHRFFNHLRTLKDPRKRRSPENNLTPTAKSEERPENEKPMSADTKSAITASADKPMKVQPNRPGQANKP